MSSCHFDLQVKVVMAVPFVLYARGCTQTACAPTRTAKCIQTRERDVPFKDDDLQRVVIRDAQLVAQRTRLSLQHWMQLSSQAALWCTFADDRTAAVTRHIAEQHLQIDTASAVKTDLGAVSCNRLEVLYEHVPIVCGLEVHVDHQQPCLQRISTQVHNAFS